MLHSHESQFHNTMNKYIYETHLFLGSARMLLLKYALEYFEYTRDGVCTERGIFRERFTKRPIHKISSMSTYICIHTHKMRETGEQQQQQIKNNKTIIIWKFYPPSSICLRNIYMTSNRLQSSEIASKATYEFQFFSQ